MESRVLEAFVVEWGIFAVVEMRSDVVEEALEELSDHIAVAGVDRIRRPVAEGRCRVDGEDPKCREKESR